MSLTELDTTLQEALQDCGLRELPPKIGADNNRWLRAIACVMKVGGAQSYVLCDNDGHGHPIVKKDFGTCAAIVFFNSIHPYEFADKTIVPTFNNDAEIIHYLSKSKYDRAEIEALLKAGDREEINRRINAVALDYQKGKAEEKKRVHKIKEYSETVKAEKEKTRSNGRKRKEKNNG